jgi:hypothetical protein
MKMSLVLCLIALCTACGHGLSERDPPSPPIGVIVSKDCTGAASVQDCLERPGHDQLRWGIYD